MPTPPERVTAVALGRGAARASTTLASLRFSLTLSSSSPCQRGSRAPLPPHTRHTTTHNTPTNHARPPPRVPRGVPPNLPPGVTVRASSSPPDTSRVLTPAAISFLALLHRAYAHRVTDLLSRRAAVQAAFDAGAKPHFLPHTAHVREGHWTVAPLPADIRDRRVEITGPPERKMVINALNSGASVFMADFEDANAPTWANQVTGQANLMDAVRRCIDFTDSASGKRYALVPSPAVLFVRPRGWHLPEAHFVVDGAPTPGALFDFGLYFFHNARELVARGTGPYFYLPKMQSHLEARLWNDVFLTAQHAVGLPHATIKATVLIETLPAAFEMDEILYELKDHSAGLNCGRWDYIFSLIKTMREDPAAVVPDRGVVTMTQPCMRAYSGAVDQDVPPAESARDGGDGGPNPRQKRSRRQRGRPGQGESRQDAGSGGWARRHVGGAPGAGGAGRGGV